jgi:GNAT superfamily N-acetyltransferase
MITTRFLPVKDYAKFASWLEIQDEETRQLYFGVAGSQHLIDNLMDRVLTDPDNHHFLVAEDCDRWVGTIHIAVHNQTVEFGVIVHEDYRGQGVSNLLMDEAITWARNRGYKELYMHCLGWNSAIKHLCHKNGLKTVNMMGDTEAELHLPPPTWVTLSKEFCSKQRNLYHKFLNTSRVYREIYG